MNQIKINLKEIIAPHFWKTFKSKKPHQIDKGGRGSTKTSKDSLKIVWHCLTEKRCGVVILRRYQNTLRKSVYKEMKRALKRFGLIENIDYTATVSPMEIRMKNGNNIYFAGGDNYEAIKGTIDENMPIKIVWFEERTEFESEEDIDNIIATFTRGNDDWFIALYSYNPPKNRFDPVNVWVEKMALRDDVLISDSDYRTVPKSWLGQMFIDEAKRLEKYDNKRYRWIYLGEVTGMEGNIYNLDLFKYRPADYIEKEKLEIVYVDFAIDSGHQSSATTFMAFGYATDGNWYLLDTYYYSPKEKQTKRAPSQYSNDYFLFQMAVLKKYRTTIERETIDSAEGALRNQLFKDYGKRLNAVNKGKNKEELIEYSIDFLAVGKFFILDNSNNQIFKKEIREYRWKKDSVEKGKPEPDKLDKELQGSQLYYNTYSKDNSYFYGDHTCDAFQYWVKDNLQKLGLRY